MVIWWLIPFLDLEKTSLLGRSKSVQWLARNLSQNRQADRHTTNIDEMQFFLGFFSVCFAQTGIPEAPKFQTSVYDNGQMLSAQEKSFLEQNKYFSNFFVDISVTNHS